VSAATAEQTQPWIRRAGGAVRGRHGIELLGALGALAAALLLYLRYSIDGTLNRDESIYAYGGQQLAHGVPPYASIFDPKTPMATMISGLAAWLGGGGEAVPAIRIAFLCCSVLTVVAVYLLALRLWRSVPAALAGAVVFASFTGFARDAIAGPDAKTPGILFAVLAMWLAAGRRWYWAGFLGGLAFLVWQPLVFYPMVAVIAAIVVAQRRLRGLVAALAGAATPVAATAVYFAAAGAFGQFVESGFVFPLAGVKRSHETVLDRVDHIAWVVWHYYGYSGLLFALGLALLVLLIIGTVVAARGRRRQALCDPVVLVVGLTLLGEAAYACYDFQSYPDLYPLLPYGALGIAGAVAVVLRWVGRWAAVRAVAVGVTLVAVVALTVGAARPSETMPGDNHALPAQRAMGCALNRLVLPGTPLYSLGDPAPLVLTGRRNPDRFIYLDSGVARWKADHTEGGFAGWTAEVRDSRASVIVVAGWHGGLRKRMGHWLKRSGYRPGYVGRWRVFLTPRAYAHRSAAGVVTTPLPTWWPQTPDGRDFHCPAS